MWLFVHTDTKHKMKKKTFDVDSTGEILFSRNGSKFEKLKCKQLRGYGNLSYSILLKRKRVNSSGCLANRNTIPIMTFQRHSLTKDEEMKHSKKTRQNFVVQHQEFIFDVFYLFTNSPKKWKKMERGRVTTKDKIHSFLTYICHLFCLLGCCHVVLQLIIFPTWTLWMFIQPKMDWKIECVWLCLANIIWHFYFHHLRTMRREGKTKYKAGFRTLMYLRCCISLNIDLSLCHFLTFGFSCR